MSDIHPLHAGATRCEVRADLGGCIAGLWHGAHAVLRSTRAELLQTARQSGSFPLVPFSNRIGQASLRWQGTDHPLVVNNAPEPHAIHGVGWQRPWAVLDASDTQLLLAHEHRADATWPFSYDASQVFKLEPGRLQLTLSVTNQDRRPAPMGLGWHPYFVKRPGARLRLVATGRWEMGADKLPTECLPSDGLDTDCELLDVDHCFDGWSGEAELRDPVLVTRIRSGLARAVVYTHPSRDFVAIEPVNHVNNALNLMAAGRGDAQALGVRVLAPGETLAVNMSLEMETLA